MDSITIYPKNEQQKSLLKSLFKEMKVRFEVGKADEQDQYSEKEFIAKIDKSLNQAKAGKTTKLSKDQQKELLGL